MEAQTYMKVKQGSRTLEAAVLLTLAGGYLDSYTYVDRGGVFANAQTGNIIKLGLRIADGNLEECLTYLVPISAFIIGVLAALFVERWMQKRDLHYIRRSALMIEIIALGIVSLIPAAEHTNMLANALVSFACAIQMEAFPVFIGQPIATTVSTGNLRKGVDSLFKAIVDHDAEKLRTALVYFLIIVLFITGVTAGCILTRRFGNYSVLVPAALMALTVFVITVRTEHTADQK